MTKQETKEVKEFIDTITGKNYTKTFASKSETLHVRIGTYVDSVKEKEKDCIAAKEKERENIIKELRNKFQQYIIEKNNKRYQGFINDICITIK